MRRQTDEELFDALRTMQLQIAQLERLLRINSSERVAMDDENRELRMMACPSCEGIPPRRH